MVMIENGTEEKEAKKASRHLAWSNSYFWVPSGNNFWAGGKFELFENKIFLSGFLNHNFRKMA